MNRKPALLPLLVGAIALVALLTACSGALVRDVYAASGDGTTPDELVKTTTFRGDDDLNVVVKLHSHNRELIVSATFTGPGGEVYVTDALEAGETVTDVVLGLDWEAQGAVFWAEGEWQVEVYVDNEIEKIVRFTVQAAEVPAAG
ncbi:MAG: hypothetical protein M5U29_17000 [Anaerolineae bacterium]|nr:hypothetical protein [Anaerolineae bacterium]